MKNKLALLSALMLLVFILVAPIVAVLVVQLVTVKLAGGHIEVYFMFLLVTNLIGVVFDILTNDIDRLFEAAQKRWPPVYLLMLLIDWGVAMLIMVAVNDWWFHLNLTFQMVGVLAGVGSIVGGLMLWFLQHDERKHVNETE